MENNDIELIDSLSLEEINEAEHELENDRSVIKGEAHRVDIPFSQIKVSELRLLSEFVIDGDNEVVCIWLR